MLTPTQINRLLPLACDWAEEQEKFICEHGVALDDSQKRIAHVIGINDIDSIRLLKVNYIPLPAHPELKNAIELTGFLALGTIGVSFRYGIYIRADHWNNKNLVVHELTHTMQYEVLGGFRPFLERYVHECLNVGYPNGSLEQEAKRVEQGFC
ncbi:hypothetical protein K3G39_20115 [Pontibacter sp. HSC-14F20]|uniref:hypothetical protein n=1 Tax=Pontibacter sp. HSC-14F20 TaxID=2864136 RepID=UPI001C72BBD6|nr:hypothetical protein [Pontibacter sp. HSC-14F20]MBX0335543.1 hypothetical protein [Pontibacter sp. HSC-14F20]